MSGNKQQTIEKRKLEIEKAQTDIDNYNLDIDKVKQKKQNYKNRY